MSIATIDVRTDTNYLSVSRVRHLMALQLGDAMECHVLVNAGQVDSVCDMPNILPARDYWPRRIKPVNKHEIGCLPNVRFFGPGHYIHPEPQEALGLDAERMYAAWLAVDRAQRGPAEPVEG